MNNIIIVETLLNNIYMKIEIQFFSPNKINKKGLIEFIIMNTRICPLNITLSNKTIFLEKSKIGKHILKNKYDYEIGSTKKLTVGFNISDNISQDKTYFFVS